MNRIDTCLLPPRSRQATRLVGYFSAVLVLLKLPRCQRPRFCLQALGWLLLSACLLKGGNTLAASVSHSKQSGPVKVMTTLSPTEPLIGDEVILEIVVEAEKDVEVLMPEFGESLQRHSILDFVPKQGLAPDGRLWSSQKYTLQPTMSGPQSIPPILIEFVDRRPGQKATPDDFDAYELLTDRIDFNVISVLPDSTSAELEPALGELALQGTSITRGNWAILSGLAIVVATIILLVLKRRVKQRVRKQNAYILAKERLERLIADRHASQPSLDIEHFYVEISALIRRYLEDRFDVNAPELTTDEFLQLSAAQSELSREHQQLLAEFLNQADVVKFAGVSATEVEIQRSCELAARFLEETRSGAPDIVVEGVKPNAASSPAMEVASRV